MGKITMANIESNDVDLISLKKWKVTDKPINGI